MGLNFMIFLNFFEVKKRHQIALQIIKRVFPLICILNYVTKRIHEFSDPKKWLLDMWQNDDFNGFFFVFNTKGKNLTLLKKNKALYLL